MGEGQRDNDDEYVSLPQGRKHSRSWGCKGGLLGDIWGVTHTIGLDKQRTALSTYNTGFYRSLLHGGLTQKSTSIKG